MLLLSTACIPGFVFQYNRTSEASTKLNSISPAIYSEVIFEVEVPSETLSDQKIYLDILDEVSGLGLNPMRFQMEEKVGSHYFVRIPINIGSIVKYRYIRSDGHHAVEYTALGKQVRYRLYYVMGQATVRDIVISWSDQSYQGGVGRIRGRIFNANTNSPITNILITAGGMRTLSASDGSFLLESLPPGIHNLVAYSLDGGYRTFQQGAKVAVDSTTPAIINMLPSKYVNVSFIVNPPPESEIGLPIRIIGNIYSMGNTFADLQGGVSTIASRAPLLQLLPDGKYSIALKLPAGMDLSYKYSLGDGFWNAEHSMDGRFRVRQLIIPETDVVIMDTIETWKIGDSNPINFYLNIPEYTPLEDLISIQFNPYGWTEPIPMWPSEDNNWFYILYNPQQLLRDIEYRYCRNDQCGTADDIETKGLNVQGRHLKISSSPQFIHDNVQDWAWLSPSDKPTTVVAVDIEPRGPSYFSGVEMNSNYQPSWQPFFDLGLGDIQDIGANWVILTPTWSLTNNTPPVLELVPGEDMLLLDLLQMINWSKKRQLMVAIYPKIIFPVSSEEWWQLAKRDSGWWQSWFDCYRTFIIHHADIATKYNADALIVGEPVLLPSLPDGKLPDGSNSGVQSDVEDHWNELLLDVRSSYSGTLMWATNLGEGIESIPNFISEVDQIYLLLSAPISETNEPLQNELIDEIGRLLDNIALPFFNRVDKPIIIGINYPSIDGAVKGCINYNNLCQPVETFEQKALENLKVSIDLEEQVDIYNAVLIAINQRDWVKGIVSRGYYPPVALEDQSSSIHGKPAADVLWYWFPKFTAQETQ